MHTHLLAANSNYTLYYLLFTTYSLLLTLLASACMHTHLLAARQKPETEAEIKERESETRSALRGALAKLKKNVAASRRLGSRDHDSRLQK